MTQRLVNVKPVSDAIKAIAMEPPAWTRLEPQSVSGDPSPGLQARMHDPLWLLTRQWQFGEFRGEDAGSPLAVSVRAASRRATAWRAGIDGSDAPVVALPATEPLDALVEREPPSPGGPSLKERAHAGRLLVDALAQAGFEARSAMVAACPLPAGGGPLADLLARRLPDAEAAARQIEAGTATWLAGASAAASDAADQWLQWFRRNVSPPAVPAAAQAWVPDRLEYRFAIAVGDDNDSSVLAAPLHEGGDLEWYSFDHAPGLRLQQDGHTAPAAVERTTHVLATPVHYRGMPANRLWQFEDGSVNLGQLEVQRHDLARLCLVEFAMVHGDDWFVVPLDVEVGSLTRVVELAYVNTFGDRYVVPPADDGGRSGRFRLFALDDGRGGVLPGLFVPPTARGSLQGRALEDVLLMRDETANLAWAIENEVESVLGDPAPRRDEASAAPPDEAAAAEGAAAAELRYRLQAQLPRHWIPLVPVATGGQGAYVLRKGTLSGQDDSRGRLLQGRPFDLRDEEVPREGLRLRRVPELARAADGRLVRWIARRASVGRGEIASGMGFDFAQQPT